MMSLGQTTAISRATAAAPTHTTSTAAALTHTTSTAPAPTHTTSDTSTTPKKKGEWKQNVLVYTGNYIMRKTP